jgi:hypothetical protein
MALDVQFEFLPLTRELVKQFATEKKIIVLMEIRNFVLKGPCHFDFVMIDNKIAEDIYSVNEFNARTNFMTSQVEMFEQNYWYSDLSEKYEDILKRLVLVRS